MNLGNPIERTVAELAEKIILLTKSESKIVYEKIPSDDPKRRKPDISLALEMLNWSPNIDIDMGLEKTISYFRGVLKL